MSLTIFLWSIVLAPIIAVLIMLVMGAIKTYQEEAKFEEELDDILAMYAEAKKQLPSYNIIQKSSAIVGKYMGRDIPSWIQLEDGRKFEYVSIAIQSSLPGIYVADDATKEYVVTGGLMYREIPSSNG